MKLLVALNSFKGSLSSLKANKICARVLKKNFPKASVKELAVADGGDGFLACLAQIKGAQKITLTTRGPLPEMRVKASYLKRKDESFIEIAQVCGLKYFKNLPLRPLEATTEGLAELAKSAIEKKSKKIYFGLGGTASSDGGLGLAAAMGFLFLDEKGEKIENSILGLLKLKKIIPPKNPNFKKIKFFAISDVSNPLLGKNGTALTYSPQKGASSSEARLIEKALGNLALRLKKDLNKNVAGLKGGGAAGGLGAGLAAFFDAEIKNGSEFIAEKLELEKFISLSDAVFTGEGLWDKTDFYGKMPYHLAKIAKKKGKKVFCVCFENKADGFSPFDEIIEIKKFYKKEFSLKNPQYALSKTLESVCENLGQKLTKNSKIS